MQNPSRPITLSILVLVAALGSLGLSAEETPRSRNRTADKAWQAVAPGRVEPVSGEIRIGSPVGGRRAAAIVVRFRLPDLRLPVSPNLRAALLRALLVQKFEKIRARPGSPGRARVV